MEAASGNERSDGGRTPRRASAAPIVNQVSAGGVVYRKRGAGPMEVILCGRNRPKQWALPKGTPDPGETIEETALREVREETGLEVRIVGDLGHIEYRFSRGGIRNHKRVYHYLMEPIGGATRLHDPEFDVVEWFPAAEALHVMTYENEARVMERARRAVSGGEK